MIINDNEGKCSLGILYRKELENVSVRPKAVSTILWWIKSFWKEH
jgi:hypothetical protein